MVLHEALPLLLPTCSHDQRNALHHIELAAERSAHVLVGPRQAFTWDRGHLRYGRTTPGIQQRAFRWLCLLVPFQPMSATAWGYSYELTLGTSYTLVLHGS